MWRSDSDEVHRLDTVEELALVQDAHEKARYQSSEAVAHYGELSDLLIFSFEVLDFEKYLRRSMNEMQSTARIARLTSSATLSPPQSIPSYVLPSLFDFTIRVISRSLEGPGSEARCSRMILSISAR